MEDDDDFPGAIGPVQPLHNVKLRVTSRRRPPPVPVQHIRDERAVLDELLRPLPDDLWLEMGEEVQYLRPGLRKDLLRRLRRGHFAIEDTLDLHHLRVRQARELLEQYFHWLHRERIRCVKIIHGKGLHSRHGPVLKNLVARFLVQRSDVLACVSPVERLGGVGAVLVLVQHR